MTKFTKICIEEFVSRLPFDLEKINIVARKLFNFSYSQKIKTNILKKLWCKLFGHKKFTEERFYEDVKKNIYVTKYRCRRCGLE